MFLPRRTSPIAPLVGYRRRCYRLTTYGGTALLGWGAPSPRGDPAMPVDETTAKEISTEARKVIVHHVDCTSEWELPQGYSSWTQLVRVTAYILRFIKNSQREKNSQPGRKLLLEVFELHEATHHWFRLVQKAHFSKEWSALSKNEPIPNSSALKALKPRRGFTTPPWRAVVERGSRIWGKTSYYIAEASHIGAFHRLCASRYSSWRHITYATPFKTEILHYWKS